mmetsp:Transcript_22633/g.69957  ORF Transcript_22633/g.69957 Transcript_22633/m.69957 type:complete len:89 (+) Transcript_22633:540-806(+)
MDVDGGADQPTLSADLAVKLVRQAAEERGDGAALKLSAGAAKTLAELVRLFVVEARDRAEAEARSEGDDAIRPEHVEASLAELLADFS